jgi:type I site-specific restriction endonuclease
MPEKEATARIKINRLLEAAGWRFFPEGGQPANIQLEPKVAVKPALLDGLGDNFERAGRGFVDFLLLDARGFPLIVLEAKAEDKEPLIGKEQARRPGLRTAASSSSATGTCTTSGTWSGAIPTSLPRSRRRTRRPGA